MKAKVGLNSGLALSLALAACSKKDDDKGGGTMSTLAVANSLAIEDEALGLKRNMQLLGVKNPQLVSQNIFGHTLATGIKSLKYRISSMQLCGVSDGTKGDACNDRPYPLYTEASNSESAYNNFVPGDASVTSFTDWTDFMVPGAVKDLVGTATYSKNNIGSYQAVVVNFYRTFRANAEVTLNNGETIYTKDVTEFYDNGKTGLDVTYGGKNDTMTTGPSEEGYFFLPNGGKTFYLQSPFEITQADYDNKVPYKMVMAFDHTYFIKGAAMTPGGMSTPQNWVEGQIDDVHGRRIAPGFLEFAPILARESETVMRETYILSTNGIPSDGTMSIGPFSARLTLYYVKEDATQTIRGVTSMAYYNDYSDSYMSFNPVGGIRSIKDGTVAGTVDIMQGYSGVVKLFKNFKRLTTVGESGTLEGEACMGGYNADGCEKPVQSVNWVYTYVGSAEADAELSIQAVEPPPPAP